MAALAGLVAERLPGSAPRKLRRELARAADGGHSGGAWGRRLDARALARLMVDQVPGARLDGAPAPPEPGGGRSGGRSRHLPRGRRAMAVAVAVGTGAVVVGVGLARSGPGGRPPYRPVAVLAAAGLEYRLATVGGRAVRTVLGHWSCGAGVEAAVLDLRTGEVWVFDRWPAPGRQVAGRLVQRVPGATGLEAEPVAAGCDHLVVSRGNGG